MMLWVRLIFELVKFLNWNYQNLISNQNFQVSLSIYLGFYFDSVQLMLWCNWSNESLKHLQYIIVTSTSLILFKKFNQKKNFWNFNFLVPFGTETRAFVLDRSIDPKQNVLLEWKKIDFFPCFSIVLNKKKDDLVSKKEKKMNQKKKSLKLSLF